MSCGVCGGTGAASALGGAGLASADTRLLPERAQRASARRAGCFDAAKCPGARLSSVD